MLDKVRSFVPIAVSIRKNNIICKKFLSTTTVPKVGSGAHNILCLPGTLGSIWTDFKAQIEGFDMEKFSLVIWDPPGYGKSRPPEKEFHTNVYETDAQYAYEFMKALQIPKYSLLGWSGGGIASIILAAKYPSVVSKLVVWGSTSHILPHELEYYKKVKDINSWSSKMKDPMIEIYGEVTLFKLWAQWVEVMHTIYKERNGNICSDVLKEIKCPTFILYGEKDALVDVAHVSHLHLHIKGSKVHLYPDGKHNIHISHFRDFNMRVQEFLLQP